MKRPKSSREAWHPPDYGKEQVRAIQALAAFASGASDQAPTQLDCQRSLDWIINTAAATYDEPFRPGQPDVRDYMLGRRSVGLAIVKLMKLKPEIFENE